MESAEKNSIEIAAAERLADRNVELRTFLLRLLHPEDLGHAVTTEVRDAVRKVLRMESPRC
jgi:hypothetical protein